MMAYRPADRELLKEVLAIPTQTYLECEMIAWLQRHFAQRGIATEVDKIGNLLAVKGDPGKPYPLVAAHTDSVHECRPITIIEDGERLIAHDRNGNQCGLGGDDKSGIFICLELIDRFDHIKGAFFVSEEIGCVGSLNAPARWFGDVGYALQFDSPCDDIVTYTCNGMRLFPDEGEFAEIALPLLEEFGCTNWQHHPYTDAMALKKRFDFVCMNLPAGYFNMHSSREYVVPEAVENSVQLGQALIGSLGTRHYAFKPEHSLGNPRHPVRGLITHDWREPERQWREG